MGTFARYDVGRADRTGVPEVVLGEGKSPGHLLGLLRALHRRGIPALVSRPTPEQSKLLRAERGLPLAFLASGRLVRLGRLARRRGPARPVALLAAGTSDVPVAEEAREALRALGVPTPHAYDVGVAGLHRLERALGRTEARRPAVYLVFAGREGALPTVVAGLVHAPVVGVPTSVGYGRGGRGEAALNAMLQSCAPVAVVNIDAAIPAALFAAQLAGGHGPGRAGRSPGRRAGAGRPRRRGPRRAGPPR